MSITKLTEKVKLAAKHRTRQQRLVLLQKAKILDEEGEFHRDFFTKRTIEKGKQ